MRQVIHEQQGGHHSRQFHLERRHPSIALGLANADTEGTAKPPVTSPAATAAQA